MAVAIQAFGIFFVVASLWSVKGQIRLQRASHIIGSVESLVATWNSENTLTLRKQVCQKMIEERTYFGSDSEELLEIFERLGMYERIGALPLDVIWEAFSWYVGHYHTLTQEGLKELRDHHGDEFLFENFEILAEKLQELSKEKGSISERTENNKKLGRFLTSEIKTANTLLNIGQ